MRVVIKIAFWPGVSGSSGTTQINSQFGKVEPVRTTPKNIEEVKEATYAMERHSSPTGAGEQVGEPVDNKTESEA